MPVKRKPQVFVAFCPKDYQYAEILQQTISRSGIEVYLPKWYSGIEFSKEDKKSLKVANVFLLIITKDFDSSHWQCLEEESFPYRVSDRHRRFVPVVVDRAPLVAPLSQYSAISVASDSRVNHEKVIAACLPGNRDDSESIPDLRISTFQGTGGGLRCVDVSANGTLAVSGGRDSSIRVWSTVDGTCKDILSGYGGDVVSVAITPDGKYVIGGSQSGRCITWEITSAHRVAEFDEDSAINAVAISESGELAFVGCDNGTVATRRTDDSELESSFVAHRSPVTALAFCSRRNLLISGARNSEIRLWDIGENCALGTLAGHAGEITCLDVSEDGSICVSSSVDHTIRIWDLQDGTTKGILEGHTGAALCVAILAGGQFLLSGGEDKTLRAWEVSSGRCIGSSDPLWSPILQLAVSDTGGEVLTVGYPSSLCLWRCPFDFAAMSKADVERYTNAKVLLVGETGVGKSALAIRLTGNLWEPSTSSSDAVWATQLQLPVQTSGGGEDREIWMWDFAGQADYRLIHQLYMDETALAVLVFNPQVDDPFEALVNWDKDISRAAKKVYGKLLVAARCDRGGITVSQATVDEFVRKNNFVEFIQTSAKTGKGCEELHSAIVRSIPWKSLPWTASPRIFRALKSEVMKLRDEGHVLLRVSELKQHLQVRLAGKYFSDEELDAVLSLLTGPGLVWRLDFGDFVLLKPEWINVYASALVRSVRANIEEIGCIEEGKVLRGDLEYGDIERLAKAEEKIVLCAMHETLVRRVLCAREHTEEGTLLIFPSYFRRERPVQDAHPQMLVTYTFTDPPEEIYATLVVKLRNTRAFSTPEKWLWRFAADFKTQEGHRIGLKLKKNQHLGSELIIYGDSKASGEAQVLFMRYVHEHLQGRQIVFERTRHYICIFCGSVVENRKAIRERIERGLTDILCVNCENRVELNDLIERLFGSAEIRKRALSLENEAANSIDNESKDLILQGHAHTTSGEAGQIYRSLPSGDWGIDGEIEFKGLDRKPTGKKVYLQLKSGDSYLRDRKKDGAEVFQIKNSRHADYWCNQRFPVMLVIRSSDGTTRWMDIRAYLRKELNETGCFPTQVIFGGERFDAMNLKRLRDKVLLSKRDI